ncbi:uncharacterized protein LOC142768599 isoform X2 [Rhipicephalus microplus]|uniref:uncharacterized protein LOC142768599 isoform X2 n=1 Tax=Rhipicephalus microplus TaxID=6941 RepID=UPI003F6D8882
MNDFRAHRLAIIVLLAAVRPNMCVPKHPGRFDVCNEKSGIVKNAKATLVATKLMEKCSFAIAMKYKYSPRMIQTGSRKLCLVFRLCFHKYQPVLNTSGYNAYSEAVYSCIAKMGPLLTVKLNPHDNVDSTPGYRECI